MVQSNTSGMARSVVVAGAALLLLLSSLTCVLCSTSSQGMGGGVDVDIIHAGLISSDDEVTVRAIESSLDANLIYACGSFSGHALFGRTSVESVGRTTFFLAQIDIAKNEVPLLFLDKETEGTSECVGLNRIGYHLYAFATFVGPAMSVAGTKLRSTGIGGMVQLEIATDDTTDDSLFVPLLSFDDTFVIGGVDVGADNLAVVGGFQGTMKFVEGESQATNFTSFVAYGDHHLRGDVFVYQFEDSDDISGMRATSVCVSDGGAMAVGGSGTAVVSDESTSSMVHEEVALLHALRFDSAARELLPSRPARLRHALLSDIELLWHADPEAIVVTGVFSGALGTQAKEHPHHFVYPAEAEGAVDGFSAAFHLDSLELLWINTMGYPGSSVRSLFAATSRVHEESSVDSSEDASRIFVCGSFTGSRLAAGAYEQRSTQVEGGATLFVAEALPSGEWTRLVALGDSTGAAEFTSDLTVNNVHTRPFMSAHAALTHGEPPEVVRIEWVGDVSAVQPQGTPSGAATAGDGAATGSDTSSYSIGSGGGGGVSAGEVLMYVAVAVVVVAAFGSAAALLLYVVKRRDFAGDDYSALPLA